MLISITGIVGRSCASVRLSGITEREGQPWSAEFSRQEQRKSFALRETLVCFRLRAPVLMRDTVLIEELRHLICHHIAVVRYRNQGDFLAWLLDSFAGGRSWLRGFGGWGITHMNTSIHEWWSERSLKCF